jgi:hypothetical protein
LLVGLTEILFAFSLATLLMISSADGDADVSVAQQQLAHAVGFLLAAILGPITSFITIPKARAKCCGCSSLALAMAL